MNIFSKLISIFRRKPKEEKKQESWYNDAAPQAPSDFEADLESQGLLTNPNARDAAITKKISMS